MNVIFLDFDGVLNSSYQFLRPFEVDENYTENRIKLVGDMCKKYDCKVVIISSHNDKIDEETLETNINWIKEYFRLFKKYGIEVIGRTPVIGKKREKYKYLYYDFWKEYEILEYLRLHPEIEHFCVIDDDDLVTIPAMEKGDFSRSDLNAVRDYLIVPPFYSNTDPNETGLQEYHIDEVGKILKKENKFKNLTRKKV